MVKFRTFATIATPFVGYYFLDNELSQRYPDVQVSELPKESKLVDYLKRDKYKYFAYTDIFKASVKSDSLDQVNLKFLSTPGISNLINTDHETNKTVTRGLESRIVKTFDSKNAKSTILKWNWASPMGIVSFFETLSSYGYPWRLMNGGIHEILVVRSKQDKSKIDIYFSTSHEYNDKRDGKVIPDWVQSLHRNYARVILYLATRE